MQEFKIVKYSKLDSQKLNEMKLFVRQNDLRSDFPTFFNWNAIANRRQRGLPSDWLCYDQDTLIAYVAIYYFGGNSLEIDLSLIPEAYYLYPELLAVLCNQMYSDFKSYKIFATIFRVNFENKVLANALLQLGATVVDSIQYMQRNLQAATYPPSNLTCKKADLVHIPILVDLQVECFAAEPAAYGEYLTATFGDLNREAYVFYLFGDPIGKAHLLYDGEHVVLQDVCVLPTMQRKGYGKALIQELCNLMHDNKHILVEVESNANYLAKLYANLGFVSLGFVHCYDRDFGPVV